MKLQVFAASAHRKWNYTLWSLLHSCIIHLCCLCQQFYQQNLPSSIINCMFLADIPNQQLLYAQAASINVQKSLSHSFLYWLQFFSWQQKEIAKPDSKQLSRGGLGREQGVSCLLCLRCSTEHLSLAWLCNKITFLFFALSLGWKDALIWGCCSKT